MATVAAIVACLGAVVGCAVLDHAPSGTARLRMEYFCPEWGPEGDWVYYVKQTAAHLPGRATPDTRAYFCRIRPDGSDDTEIFELWPERSGTNCIGGHIWSATLDIHNGRRRAALCVLEQYPRGLFTFDLDAADFRRVLPAEYRDELKGAISWTNHASWSPDGEWLVYEERRYGRYRVVKCREDGSGYTLLYPPDPASPIDARAPAWDPNGGRIAFMLHPIGYGKGQGPRLHAMDENGALLRSWKASGSDTEWSRDGRYLLVDGGGLVEDASEKAFPASEIYGGKPHTIGSLAKWGPQGWVGVRWEGLAYMPVPGATSIFLRAQARSVPTRNIADPQTRISNTP